MDLYRDHSRKEASLGAGVKAMDIEIFRTLPDMGLRLFPVIPDGKTPAVKNWQEKASSEWDRLGWLLKGKHNAGVFAGKYEVGNSLVVIDLDNKHGKNGQAAMDLLYDPLPETLTVKTPSNGRHLYFKTTEKIRSGVDVLGPGVDIRSQGGYVVAPGSSTPEGEYTVITQAPIADAPRWLLDLLPKAGEIKENDRKPLVDLDKPEFIERATQYLETKAEPAIEGHGGDLQTFKTACMVKDIGVSEYSALVLMEEFYNPKCIPPWEHEALAIKVNSAYRNGANPPGSKAVSTDEFEAVKQEDPFAAPAEPEAPKSESKPLPLIHFAECKPDLNKIDLIEDIFSQGAASVTYGEANSGKTFVTVDMAFHIAAGWDWMGRKVFQSPSLIVAAEGGGGIRNRMAAIQIVYGARLTEEGRGLEDVPFYIIPASVDLRSNLDDAKRLLDQIRVIQARHNKDLGFGAIDTLSRALAGGNENGPEDMGAYIRTIDLLRQATRSHINSVHHCGKNTEMGARGHSSLRAAVDTELEVRNSTIFIEKQREMEYAEPIGFELITINLGTNSYGKPITSCAVSPAAAGAKKAKPEKKGLKPIAKFFLDSFAGALDLANKDDKNFITKEEWRDYSRNMAKTDNNPNALVSLDVNRFGEQFRRAITQLSEAKCVIEIQRNQWVRIE